MTGLLAALGKGVFTKELEDGLLNNYIDIAVHSAKDMPMELPKGLVIGAVLERADTGCACDQFRNFRKDLPEEQRDRYQQPAKGTSDKAPEPGREN